MKSGCFFMSYNIKLLLVIRQQQITFALFAQRMESAGVVAD